MRSVIIVGLDKEVIELAESLPDVRILGVLDPEADIDCLGHVYLGNDASWQHSRQAHPDPETRFIIAVDTPRNKERLIKTYGVDSLSSLVSPFAEVSSRAKLGLGHIVQFGCRIHACASSGVGCKINSDAVVHHDCILGNYCTLAPGSRLLGQVSVGDRVFVGAGAIILPKVSIGSDSVIGAGAVVVKDVPKGSTMVGVPARRV